jgi:hypothetical protein
MESVSASSNMAATTSRRNNNDKAMAPKTVITVLGQPKRNGCFYDNIYKIYYKRRINDQILAG